jgi:translation initiation factor IF-1
VDGDRIIEVNAQVQEVLQNGQALVKLSDGSCILAELSAKIKVRFISVQPGDIVRCELSPFDPSKARITDKL